MKKFLAVFALTALLAVSACNNNGAGQPADTSAAETTGKKVTAVAFESEERPDTTEDALKYIEQNAPLYYNYLKLRRSVPLTLEATTTSGDETIFSGLYIKDKDNIAQYSKSSSGVEKTVLYMTDKAYEINHTTKTVYTFDCGTEDVEIMYKSLSLAVIYLDDVMASTYATDTAEYEGTEYDRVAITSALDPTKEMSDTNSVTSYHYFDKSSGSTAYTITESGEHRSVSKIERFENAFDNDSIFTVPTDYTQKTYEDLLAEHDAQQQALAEAYEAEQAAQSQKAE
ncbi:MAG: hypothetical protein J6N15_09980 [Ruminiclostridium sp.]|nr:hypothetical protein [Ruminiclostridium sp.]